MTNAAEALIDAEEVEAEVVKPNQAVAHRQDTPSASTVATPMAMIDRALAMNANPDTLEKLLALQERWEANRGRKAFDEAMAAAKAEIPTIRKNRVVDFTSSKGRTHYRHEDLAEIAATVNPILGRHGLSYRYRVHSEANAISVTCIVSHRLGYSEETTLTGRPDESGNKNAIQQVGSTLTYLQRMTLKAALGLAASEDDDGQKSEGDTGTISEDQARTIRKLAEDNGRDLEKFCEYFKIDAVPDLPAKDFGRAVTALSKKKEG